MDKLKAQVESEIERVYANKETKEIKERQSVFSNSGVETQRGKADGISLNEDLFGLDTLEPPD